MKTGYVILIIALGLALGFVLFYKGCKQGKPIDVAPVDHRIDSILKLRVKDSVKIDMLQDRAYYWMNRYDSLHNAFTNTENKIIASANKVRVISDSLKYYRKENDTLKQLTQIGDLLDEDSILLSLLDHAKIEIDSLHESHVQESTIKDSIILDLRSEITQLGFALSDCKHEFDEAAVKYNKELSKAKTNKLLTKVLAVTTAIFITTTLIKK
jgi:hypothetical protein